MLYRRPLSCGNTAATALAGRPKIDLVSGGTPAAAGLAELAEEGDKAMRRPRLKSSRCPARFPGNRIQIGWVSDTAGEIMDDEEGTIWRLLELMDGTRSPEAVLSCLLAERPSLDQSNLRDALGDLMESGCIEDAGGTAPDQLSPQDTPAVDRDLVAWRCWT
jgi:hypothetical protein